MNPLVREIRSFLDDSFLSGQKADQIANGDSLVNHGITDSKWVQELVSFLEEKYPIRIADEELNSDHLDSINSLVVFLERKLAAARDCA